MFDIAIQAAAAARRDEPLVGVSIVMPCLNEALSLPHCLASAQLALDRIQRDYGLTGEIVVADNGSTDGSQELAELAGARVVTVVRRGYGAAITGGCGSAFGDYLLIGDADGSYDFADGVAMIGQLIAGADLCMGSRFRGGIAPGAMPWKNRHIGNPALTGILNLFFRTGVDDAHCGLRAISRNAFLSLDLSGSGMEFASEMVVKASLRRMRIVQTPAKLSLDLRDRPPHLRPWRDGWRHLRYLIMMSPTWAFGSPGLVAIGSATAILTVALLHGLGALPGPGPFGASWTIVAGFLLTCGHFAAVMAFVTHLHGVRAGYRRLRPTMRRIAQFATLEMLLSLGLAMVGVAIAMLVAIGWHWSAHSFAAPASVLPLVIAGATGAIGMQTMFGAVALGIVAGHSAELIPTRIAAAGGLT